MSSYPGQGLPWLVSNEGFPGEDFSNDNVSAVSAGGTHACLVQQGNAWCLGSNYTGQVGHGSVGNNAEPLAPVVARPGDSSRLSGVTAINAGESQGGESNQRAHTCAITGEPPNAQTYCWGNNSSGQLGDGKFDAGGVGVPVKVNVPVVSSLPNGDVASVSAGVEHTCAVTQAGAAYCWGNGYDGALGTGKSGKVASPVPVAEPEGGVQGLSPTRQISAGVDFTCAVGTSAGAFCFGLNNQGQLGIGTAEGPENSAKICQNTARGEEPVCSLWPLAVSGQLRVFPSPVVLPDTKTGDATTADVRLRASFLAESVDVKVDIPKGDKEGFAYSPSSGCATTGNIVAFTEVNCLGQIDFSPQKLGQYSATMRLTPLEYPYADAEFLISGLATGDSSGAVVSGDPVDFGDVSTFTAKKNQAIITNIGDSPLRVAGVKIANDPDDEFAAPKSGNRCLGKTIQPGDSCKIAVQFFPRHLDTSVALLKLQSNAQGKATIGLTGVGVATDSSGVSLGKVRKLNAPSKKTKSKRALVKWKRPKTQLPVTSYQTRTKKCIKKSAGGWNCKKPSWSKWRDKDPRPNVNGWISRDYRKLTPQTRYKVQVRALSNDIRGKKSAIPVTTTKTGVPTRPGNG
ncbi:MAG: choice-of-anchor D domain-containing protein [Actinomycetia bacterium]|nr:choice-of-anchor D domain-containing protein [Actinomycetes bacterium]